MIAAALVDVCWCGIVSQPVIDSSVNDPGRRRCTFQFWRLSRQALPVPLLAPGNVGAAVVSAAQAQLTDRTRARVLDARWIAIWLVVVLTARPLVTRRTSTRAATPHRPHSCIEAKSVLAVHPAGGKTPQVPWQTAINRTSEGISHGFWASG